MKNRLAKTLIAGALLLPAATYVPAQTTDGKTSAVKTSAVKTAAPAAAKQAGNWDLVCGKTNCSVHTETRVKKNPKVVFSSIDFVATKDGVVGLVLTPLGIAIQGGVVIIIDDKLKINTKIGDCNAEGCRAFFVASEPVIEALIKGLSMKVQFVNAADSKTYSVAYSLIGFTNTYRAMQKKIRARAAQTQ